MSDLRTANPRTDNSFIAASGRHAIIEATITRPATTTQYTANDSFASGTPAATPMKFDLAAIVNGGGGKIVAVTAILSQNPTTKPDLKLYLFSGSPTIPADNAPFDISDASAAKLLPGGIVYFRDAQWVGMGTTAGTAGNAVAFGSALNGVPIYVPYQCEATSRAIWGAAVEAGTYTPVASETLTFRVGVLED